MKLLTRKDKEDYEMFSTKADIVIIFCERKQNFDFQFSKKSLFSSGIFNFLSLHIDVKEAPNENLGKRIPRSRLKW